MGKEFKDMGKKIRRMTTSQFAKLHEVNKRTLHYYDHIGLFSPSSKGENGYRYYDVSQSITFEYIRMLKELNMSIGEIADYCKNPTSKKFLQIADIKEAEIDCEIQKLKRIKKILKAKKEQIHLCEGLTEQEIRIEECDSERISILPYDFLNNDISQIFSYLKDNWNREQIRMGIGSFISLDKVNNKDFDQYDGFYIYTFDKTTLSNTVIKPKGRYLCGYQKGTWDKAPVMYEKMIAYAHQHHLSFTGYAYEIGLNEVAISSAEEYVTKFMIKIEE